MSHAPVDAATTARLLLAGSSEILLLVDGASRCILAANDAAATQLGYSALELCGRPIGELECALADLFFWDEMRNASGDVQADSALVCADGRVLDVSKVVRRVSSTPEIYVLRATPLAARQESARELARLGSHLRATLEATADAIMLLDVHGAIVNINQRFAALWSLPETLLEGRDDAALLRHMHAQCVAMAGGAPVAPGEPPLAAPGADILRLADGRAFECAVHAARAGEEIIGRVYSYRDVTEREQVQADLRTARDEARRASAAKGEFLAMMSHEIRTPMNGILGIADLLAQSPLNVEQRDHLRVIRSSGETLQAIINDVLDYSKVEAGKMTLERIDFALAPLLEETMALFRARVDAGGPRLTCHSAPDVPARLVGDPVRLRQILFNLIGNAFKFTEHGRIDVQVSRLPDQPSDAARHDSAPAPLPANLAEGAVPPKITVPSAAPVRLRFVVRDTGIGLSDAQAAGLFQQFAQADSSTTRKFGGTGLGLAICKRIVELMGGEIGVRSALGAGAEFWFTVGLDAATPAMESATPESAPAGGPAAARPLHEGVRVLLVDDNLVNRKVMTGMLQRLGGQVPEMAVNGQEAVDKALAQHFDVILMDAQMPVMDGLEATRRLRAAGLRTPIIGVSAGALEDERRAALAAGMSDYVAKPVGLPALAAALARALAATPVADNR